MFAIFGTGGFGRELIRPAIAMLGPRANDLAFVVDEPHGSVLGVPVLSAESLTDQDEIIIALGDPASRKKVAARLKGRPGILAAPTSVVGLGVNYGEGTVLCDFTVITSSARIGRHFLCNIYSYVAHDCVIGDFVTFGPRVSCNGNVHIRDGAFIGTGAVLKQGSTGKPLTIGKSAVVGMGAVVTKDVPDGAIVVGNPARRLARPRQG